jgi:hypothetical protein
MPIPLMLAITIEVDDSIFAYFDPPPS